MPGKKGKKQTSFGQFDGGAGTAAAKRGKAKAKPKAKAKSGGGGSKPKAKAKRKATGPDMASVRRAMGRGRVRKG